MSSCPHVIFSFNSTSNDNNLTWLSNAYDIFVNYHYSNELFMDFSSIIKKMCFNSLSCFLLDVSQLV
jgi:hypothetical protein